ncbi:MAG: aminotransferase class V-fold PLP-dependent enzyme [Planctomycetota bacterium]
MPDAPDQAGLDRDEAWRRDLGEAALARVLRFIATLDEQAICGAIDDLDRFRALHEPPPEEARPVEALLDRVFTEVVPPSFHTAHPGYMAYVPGGGLYPAAIGAFVAAATNRFSGVWQAAPGLAEVEACVLGWFRDWMGFPAGTRGLLTPGGSMSTLAALVTARERHLGRDLREGVLYASVEVHHCVTKAARLAGIFDDRVRLLPVDGGHRLDLDRLAAAVAADRRAGLRPFLVVSSAGTVHTGVVDDIAAVGTFCREQELWHHVDGAYGGFFHVVPELAPLLAGLPDADSLALDPHKGLFQPYGSGALLVRDGEALRAAHEAHAGYLPDAAAEGFYDPSQYGPELSRPWRGLPIWLSVQSLGMAALRRTIAERRELALAAAARLAEDPRLEVLAPPTLSLFAFRLRAGTPEVRDARTRELLLRLRARGRVMLSGCRLDGAEVGRVCVLSFRTRPRDVDALAEDLAAVLDELVGPR